MGIFAFYLEAGQEIADGLVYPVVVIDVSDFLGPVRKFGSSFTVTDGDTGYRIL